MTTTNSTRKTIATDRFRSFRDSAPEFRRQRLDSWLQVATAAEVRKLWKPWMGTLPGFAAL